jgi:hypothetical protein
LAAVFVILAGGVNALAIRTQRVVWTVSATSSVSSCAYPSATTCNNIQSAVNVAIGGDIIVVGAGYYNESVYIGQSNISILGAQAGRDARERWYNTSEESIVDATGQGSPGPTLGGGGAAFYVDAPYVVIDGFTIEGGTSGEYGSGIYVDAPSTQILDNIIHNNAIGVYLNSYYDLAEYNLFKTNNAPTSGSSIGSPFYGVQGYGIVGAGDFLDGSITENAFEGNSAAAIYLYYGWYDEVTKNTSEKDGSFLVCYVCYYDYLDHNQGRDFRPNASFPIAEASQPADAAIDLLYYNEYLQINDNDLGEGKTSGYSGIAFSNIAATGICCNMCQVTNNKIRGFAGKGIVAEAAVGSTGTLYGSWVLRNVVEDNGRDGILIASGSQNITNMVLDNKAQGNGVEDCADDTGPGGLFTAGTRNTWFNNIGSSSFPSGLCAPGGWHEHE